MLLAAQQTLPSRALKAEPARRWAPEERREGEAGFVTPPGVTQTARKNGCCPPGRVTVPAHVPLPSPSGRGDAPGNGVGGRAGGSLRSRARGRRPPAGRRRPGRSGRWGFVPFSGDLAITPAPERSPHKRVIWSRGESLQVT